MKAHIWPSVILTIWFIVLTGLVFPFTIWAISQIAFPHQANGSMIRDANGEIVGSELIGQNFAKPEYFHPRPSAAGSGYDAADSSGTNLGPTSDRLVNGTEDDPKTPDVDESFAGIKQLAEAFRAENGLSAEIVLPADAVTRSGSGLDPHISLANARLQAARVARARNIAKDEVERLIGANTDPRFAGVFGDPGVNVLKLNLALDATAPMSLRR